MAALQTVSLPFTVNRIEKTIKDVLEAYLRNVKYDPYKCSRLSHDMCTIIKDKTKELQEAGANDDASSLRKLVVHVLVGQDNEQSVIFSSRCVWDAGADCLASATYRNNSVFAIGVVYALSQTSNAELPMKKEAALNRA